MLVLSRKTGESVVIDGRIKVKVVRLEGDVVKLGIEAPPDVPVHRQEVYDEILQSNVQALQSTRSTPPRITRKEAKPSNPENNPSETENLSGRSKKETAGIAA